MDSVEDSGSDYVEEDNASGTAALDSARLSCVVQEILVARRHGEGSSEAGGGAGGAGGAGGVGLQPGGPNWLLGLDAPFQPPLGESSEALREFSEAVASIRARQHVTGNRGFLSGLEVRSYLDLQDYDLKAVAEKRRREPSSLQLMYMFYSRIYEKLVGKQRGVDVPLFAPIDLSQRLLGFRGILDLAHDFELCPARVGRRELERIFATVHAGPGDESPRKKIESKITYGEFVEFVALCSEGGEPMDRSRMDNSRARTQESRLDRVKRLATYLALPNVKKVKLALHNAYRDVHFWKLSDGADFEKEARAAEMRSRPQWRVELVPLARRLGRDATDASCLKFLGSFTWLPLQTWEEYEGPILDMGTSFVGGAAKHFRLTLTNRQQILARVKLEVLRGGPLRMPWRDTMLGPGQSIEVNLDLVPLECGEWCGAIAATAEWKAGAVEVTTIPTYARVLQPQVAAPEVAARLPWHAPRPFVPGSARRITVDPASIAPHQLRPPTPQRSRSSTRSGSRPASAVSCASGLPPRFPSSHSSRPGSGLRSAPTGSAQPPRIGGGGGDGGGAAPPKSGPSGGWCTGGDLRRARSVSARPHSAPSASPHKARPGACPPEPSLGACTAAGAGAAAVRARPRSASIRRHHGLPE